MNPGVCEATDDGRPADGIVTGTTVFVYGSLMSARVWQAVTGRPWNACRPARLPGWRRHALRDRDYPGLVPSAGADTTGLCILDVDAGALARLDAFEGSPYRRVTVEAVLDDGDPRAPVPPDAARVPAQVYAWLDRSQCLDEDWDPMRFEAEFLAGFLARHGF